MKRIYAIIILALIVGNVKSQTGVTNYTIPFNATKTCLTIDHWGNKWFGTTGAGLIKFDGNVFTHFDTLTSSIPDNRILSVHFDATNILWVGTNKGLAKYDGSNWITYNIGNSSIPNDTINCITSQGANIWVGTKNGVGNLNGSIWTSYTPSNSGLSTRSINCLAIDLSNDLYVGTNAGLFRKSGNVWTDFSMVSQYHTEHMMVQCVYVDAANTKWIGGNGVYLLSGSQFLNARYQYPNSGNIPFGVGYSIIKGPRGGAMIGNIELVGGQVYWYTGVNFASYVANDNNGLIWIVGYNTISSFNYQNYTVGNPLVYVANPNYAFLNVNEVNAEILNRGDMFWDQGGTQNASYEVPKGSNKNAQFASALWIGGVDNGGLLHTAAMTYRQSGVDYWLGPLDTISGSTDSATSERFNRLWNLDKFKINEFRSQFTMGNVQNGNYAVDSNIITWPAIGTGNYSRNLSPFVDVNHDGLYRPLIDGDYPLIKGDQMIYWIYNDALPHTLSGGLPLKVEIHGSAYAYACPNITDSLNVLNYTTFYNYKIINRSTDNFHNTHIGYWDDADLGYAFDDFAGCDSSKNYAMLYNGTNIDGSGQLTAYGTKPPMISAVVLNGPNAEPNDGIDNNNNGVVDETGEKNLMTSFVNSDIGTNGQSYFNSICGLWSDSTNITYGGNGVSGTIPTKFMYNGALDNLTAWTEISTFNVPSDRRFVMGCGPFNLNAGQSVEFDMAQVFTRDTISVYTIGNLYEKNRDDVRRVQQWFAVDSFPSCLDLYAGINEPTMHANDLISISPNPSSGIFKVTSAGIKLRSVRVFNLVGEEIWNEIINNREAMIDLSKEAKGIYFVKMIDENNNRVNKKIVVE